MKQLLVKTSIETTTLSKTLRGQVSFLVLEHGQQVEGTHTDSDQWLYVLSGEGKAVVCGTGVILIPGRLLLIERGEEHELSCTSYEPLKMIDFSSPPAF
jgi:mannose-6-phosphate isomerase-like protein (cupin superfamily)